MNVIQFIMLTCNDMSSILLECDIQYTISQSQIATNFELVHIHPLTIYTYKKPIM